MFEGYNDAKSAIMESLLRILMDNQPAFEELQGDIKKLIGRINFNSGNKARNALGDECY